MRVGHIQRECLDIDVGSRTLHAQLLRTDARRPNSPLVIFSHGFITTGVENAGLFMRCARAFQRAGFDSVLFDQVGCGYSSGDYTDFRVRSAARHLVSVAFEALRRLRRSSEVVIVGQSLGTAVAILAIAQSPEFNRRLRGLVLWHLSAEISTRYDALFGPGLLELDEFCVPHKGYIVSSDLLREMATVDVLAEYAKVMVPTLFLESGCDEVGDGRFSEVLIESAPMGSRRIVIEGANHSFSCQPDHERRAICETVDFVGQLFSK